MLAKAIWFAYNFYHASLVKARRKYYGMVLKSCGANLIVSADSTISYPGNVEIGKNLFVAVHVSLNGHGGLTIGDNVLIARNTNVWTSNHIFSDLNVPIAEQGYVLKPVVICDDVWIGSNVVILPGITIGKGAVIGAGAIVTNNIPPYSIAVGNPARVVKTRI